MKLGIKEIGESRFIKVVVILILIFLLAQIGQKLIEYELRESFFERFDKISQSNGVVNINLASLPPEEEKEIQETIKKSFEGRWNYYYDGDKSKLDQSIKNLYFPLGYSCFKGEVEKEFRDQHEGIVLKDIPCFIKNIKFSKFRKYNDFGNRIGVIAGFTDKRYDIHYFLFKKENGQWKIEKESFPDIGYSFHEIFIIKELIEKKNNETPKAKITEYLGAIKQKNETEALKIWQLYEEEKWKSNYNYSLLKNGVSI